MSDLPAFLDALDKRMNDWMQKFGVGEPAPMLALQNMIRGARDDIAAVPTVEEICDAMAPGVAALRAEIATPALGWSEWLEWSGGPCPLPGDTTVEVEYISNASHGYLAAGHDWSRIRRFRYRCDPSGGLPRGDFVPTDALWDEACPVRLEWTCTLSESGVPGRAFDTNWKGVNFIRIVPREKAGEACEMPDKWRIDEHGILRSPLGAAVLSPDQFKRYGSDTIRRAVDAWIASMKERGE